MGSQSLQQMPPVVPRCQTLAVLYSRAEKQELTTLSLPYAFYEVQVVIRAFTRFFDFRRKTLLCSQKQKDDGQVCLSVYKHG